MKVCIDCKESLAFDLFYKNHKAKDGYASKCKPCTSAYQRTLKDRPKVTVVSKVCGRCKIERTASEFYKERSRRDGLGSYCKACSNHHTAEWQRANPESRKRHYDKFSTTDKFQSTRRKNGQKRRALERNALVPGFAEPLTEVLVSFYGKTCLVPGCEDDRPTLDHVVALENGGKHTYYNTQPLCGPHNSSKGNRHDTDYRLGVTEYGVLIDRVITT